MSNSRATSAVDVALGRLVKAARVRAGLSQQALGDRLGVAFQQVQKYEAGTNRISASRLIAIAAVLELPLAYFLGDQAVAACLPQAEHATSANGRISEAWGAPDVLLLVDAFASIKSPRVRQQLLALARAIVDSDEATLPPMLS